MTRTAPLPRITPLQRGGSIKAGLRRPRMKRDLRSEVIARAHGRCDMCGQQLDPDDWECHHRKLRAQGGRDELANLLALHGSCHRVAHHYPAWSYDRGYLVRRGDEPDSVPVLLHGRTPALPGPAWAVA